MPRLNILSAIVLWLVVSTGGELFLLPTFPSVVAVSLLFFNNLNVLIALCEIALGKHIMFIKDDYKKLSEKYKGREWEACISFLTMPLSLSQLFDGRCWGKMWSTYALYDPSYQNYESFGFFIDVGNGWSTIPPGLLWNYAILFPKNCSPLLLGAVGLCHYWQVMYGTIIYVLSYVFNQRYKGRKTVEVLGFVGFSNSLWFFFPIVGIYTSVCILRDNDMSVFEA